jgi:hypothetical protein
MKGCNIEIALKARPRMSLLAAAVVTLSGAFFSAQAQEPIKIGFGVSLTGGLASSGKAHLMSNYSPAAHTASRPLTLAPCKPLPDRINPART